MRQVASTGDDTAPAAARKPKRTAQLQQRTPAAPLPPEWRRNVARAKRHVWLLLIVYMALKRALRVSLRRPAAKHQAQVRDCSVCALT
jgi:hypothetical protein